MNCPKCNTEIELKNNKFSINPTYNIYWCQNCNVYYAYDFFTGKLERHRNLE